MFSGVVGYEENYLEREKIAHQQVSKRWGSLTGGDQRTPGD